MSAKSSKRIKNIQNGENQKVAGWLAARLDGSLAGWMAAWMAAWLADRLAGWMPGWLDGWLADGSKLQNTTKS